LVAAGLALAAGLAEVLAADFAFGEALGAAEVWAAFIAGDAAGDAAGEEAANAAVEETRTAAVRTALERRRIKKTPIAKVVREKRRTARCGGVEFGSRCFADLPPTIMKRRCEPFCRTGPQVRAQAPARRLRIGLEMASVQAAEARPGRSAAPEHRPAHRTSLALIAFAHGTSDFYSGIVPLVVYFVVAGHGLSAAIQGALIFLWYLTSSIVQPLFGAFSDRRGRWWFLPASIVATTSAVSLAGLATGALPLGACIIVGGFGSAIMHPEAGKYAAMVSGSKRASGISIFQIGGQIGYALGPAVAAVVLARFGGAGLAPVSLFGFAAAALLFARMPHVDRIARDAHARPKAALGLDGRVDLLGIALLATSTALRHFVTAAFVTFLPNVLVGAGYSLSFAGGVVSAFLLVSAIGLYGGGSLADRFGAVRVSAIALLGSVPFLIGFFKLLAMGPDYITLAVMSLVAAGVLLAAQNAPGVALVQSMLPRNLGMALGLMNGVAFGAGSAAVAFTGIWVARYGAGATLSQVAWAAPLLAAATFSAVRIPRRSPMQA
jgi:FSR family fosmidomycin resistance protein-like MFS transporter